MRIGAVLLQSGGELAGVQDGGAEEGRWGGAGGGRLRAGVGNGALDLLRVQAASAQLAGEAAVPGGIGQAGFGAARGLPPEGGAPACAPSATRVWSPV